MTIEEAKKELREYRDNIKYIEEKQNDIEEIKTRLEKVTSRISMTKTSNINTEGDSFSNGIIKLQALQQEYDEKLKELMLKKYIIDEKIDKLDTQYRNILFFRYARNMNWDKIAERIGYDERYTYKLHGKALFEYTKIK